MPRLTISTAPGPTRMIASRRLRFLCPGSIGFKLEVSFLVASSGFHFRRTMRGGALSN
jgi:hypothetical protein